MRHSIIIHIHETLVYKFNFSVYSYRRTQPMDEKKKTLPVDCVHTHAQQARTIWPCSPLEKSTFSETKDRELFTGGTRIFANGGGGGKWGELSVFLWEGRAEKWTAYSWKRNCFGAIVGKIIMGWGRGWTSAPHAPPRRRYWSYFNTIVHPFWSHSVLKLNPPSQIIINSTPKYELYWFAESHF